MPISHRIFVDLDELGQPIQCWVERWRGGEPVKGFGVDGEPFWSADEWFVNAMSVIDVQQRLF